MTWCKHCYIAGKIKERPVMSRHVIGALKRIMKGRSVSVGVKRLIRIIVILPALTCIRNVDMEYGTVVSAIDSGVELYKSSM